MPNDQMAVRAFGDVVNTSDSMVAKHPEDFSLYCVGMFDDSNGNLEEQNPINLVTAASLKRGFNLGSPMKAEKVLLNGEEVQR